MPHRRKALNIVIVTGTEWKTKSTFKFNNHIQTLLINYSNIVRDGNKSRNQHLTHNIICHRSHKSHLRVLV